MIVTIENLNIPCYECLCNIQSVKCEITGWTKTSENFQECEEKKIK